MTDSKPVMSLVLSGGGVRALAHVGAITRLEQLGMLEEFTHFSGASAGAGIATLLAAGYSCEELFRFMITLDYRSFVDHNPIKEGLDLVRKYGLHAPIRLQEAFDKGLEKKVGKDATFASILHRTGNTLIIPATNLSLGKIDVFSPTTSPNMLIRDALRLTTDIPLFFTSQMYNGHTYTDGGVLNNLPIDLVPQPSIAFNLVAQNKLPQSTANLSDYLYTLLETVANKIESLEASQRPGHIIKINTGDIDATDFDLSFVKKVGLVRKGFEATKSWMPPATLVFPHIHKQLAPPIFPPYWSSFLQDNPDHVVNRKDSHTAESRCTIQ